MASEENKDYKVSLDPKESVVQMAYEEKLAHKDYRV
jgi:hypothetical protein